ncbi:MAG: DUF4870 domain-containing protein [Leptolyngbya sp. SIO1D8]|nr:DUF4870 domain-containing protein [Leptolyngbya sp. SIO1D8]
MNDPDKRKVLSALCHGACFFSSTIVSVGIPIAILVLVDDPIVKANAKEALNFQITVFIWALIGLALIFVLIGFAILAILFVFSVVAPLIAIISVLADPDRRYKYSFIFHFA